jgi:hypothetical protein
MSAVPLVQHCCRDENGLPWPPIPTGVQLKDLRITKLAARDVPGLQGYGVARGADFDKGRYPPFPNSWQPTVAICARWQPGGSEAALLEWLDHHRCAAAAAQQCMAVPFGVHLAHTVPAATTAADCCCAAPSPNTVRAAWQTGCTAQAHWRGTSGSVCGERQA